MSRRASVLALGALGVVVFCVCLVTGLGAVVLILPRVTEQPVRPAVGIAPPATPTQTVFPTATIMLLATATASLTSSSPTATPTETSSPIPPPTGTPRAQPTLPSPVAAALCHPSYPDFCIPPPPPLLTCGSPILRLLPNYRPGFRVLHDVPNPDPHGFDRERTGRGCVE